MALMKLNRLISIVIILLKFNFNTYGQGLYQNQSDTFLIVSITVFDKSEHRTDRFPDVFPNISNLFIERVGFANEHDSFPCRYEFPYLRISKKDLVKIRSSDTLLLLLNYNYIRNERNERYLLTVPIHFKFTVAVPIFILIETKKRKKFWASTRWGGIYVPPLKIKSSRIF
jgi:hypothetical protein